MVKKRFTRQLWIGFGIVLGSIAIAAWAVSFLSGSIAGQANAIVNDRATIQGKTDAVANLAQLKAQAPQAQQYQQAIDQLLPNQFGLVSFPQWVAQLGTQYSVTANAVLQGSVTPSTGSTAGTVDFSFNAVGLPSNVTSFLDAMVFRSSGFLVSVTSFDVTSAGANQTVAGKGILFFH